VSYNGSGTLWPAFRARGWRHVLHQLQAEEAGLPSALYRRLLKPALRPAWNRLKAARAPQDRAAPWSRFALINPGLARELDLPSAMARAGHDAGFIVMSPERMARFRLGLLGGADNGSTLWAALGDAHGLDTRDPTRDQRLVELCWRLPDELFWAHGRQRGLIRASMQQKLPAAVLNCRAKGLQSADLKARLRACHDDLSAEIASLARHPQVCAWLDMPRLQLSAQAVLDDSNPAPTGIVDAFALMRALAAAMFIAREA
jgi:asparagine synthase (glutamine-hydrolysing)